MIARLKTAVRRAVSLAVVILPAWLKIPIYRKVFGYQIGRHVSIGLSWIDVEALELQDHVFIGHLNRFKGIPRVRIGAYTRIGTGNTFTASPEFTDQRSLESRGNRPELIIGRHCGIALLHYFDVQDQFTIGDYTVVAGKSSVFFTHYLDVLRSVQATRAIHIGDHCMFGSNVRVIPGGDVAACCVVGMGAVITKPWTEEYSFLGGNPAVLIRKLPKDAAYFHRATGWIGQYVSVPFDGPEDAS